MALSIRYWLFLVQPLQHDLPLEHDTTGWAPPDHPSDVRNDGITSLPQTRSTHNTPNGCRMPRRMVMWNPTQARIATPRPMAWCAP